MEPAARANALIDSIFERVSERELAAAAAAERLALLSIRADNLRGRCEKLGTRRRAALAPHLAWLAEVRTTTALAIGVLGKEGRDFEEDKAEVLLWARAFKREIDALELRVEPAPRPRRPSYAR